MARIVIDAREYATSTGRYVSKLIENLQLIDKENEYLVLLKPADIERCPLTAANFKAVACPYKEFSFDEQLGFAKQLYSLKADLVHFAMAQQPLLYLKRSVTTIHDLTTARFTNPDKNPAVFIVKQQVYKAVVWYAAHKSQAVISPTNYVKQDLIAFSHVRHSKINVTLESADPIAEPTIALPDLKNQEFIMYIGRPTPHKNLWRLIEAYHSLQPMYPKLKLVLAGKLDANYQAIKQRVEQAGIKGIYFTGFINDGELRWLYEHTKAYVFPSLSEGFGLPGLEAMAHGAPVVSSNATCLPEVYGDAAHYFDPRDPTAIAQAISSVLSDKALRDKLVKAGKAKVASYSWKRMAEQTLEVYNQALKQRS